MYSNRSTNEWDRKKDPYVRFGHACLHLESVSLHQNDSVLPTLNLYHNDLPYLYHLGSSFLESFSDVFSKVIQDLTSNSTRKYPSLECFGSSSTVVDDVLTLEVSPSTKNVSWPSTTSRPGWSHKHLTFWVTIIVNSIVKSGLTTCLNYFRINVGFVDKNGFTRLVKILNYTFIFSGYFSALSELFIPLFTSDICKLKCRMEFNVVTITVYLPVYLVTFFYLRSLFKSL